MYFYIERNLRPREEIILLFGDTVDMANNDT